MNKRYFLAYATPFCLIIALLTTACSTNAPSGNTQSASVTRQNVSKISEQRNGFQAECNLNFPTIAAPAMLRDSVQMWSQRFICSALLDLQISVPIQEAVTRYFSRFDAIYTQPEKEYNTSWLVETHDSVLLNTPQVLSLRLSGEAFVNGAHNKLHSRFANFDPATGKMFDILATITDRDALRNLCEAEFARLNEAGTFHPDDVLPLSQNIALTPQGLLCYYDVNETTNGDGIGATEFVIPYAALDRILDKHLATWLPSYWLP